MTLRLEASDTVDSRVIIGKLRRRRTTIVVTSLSIFLCLAIATYAITPQYNADSMVMIDKRQPRVVAFQQVMAELPDDQETVQSEALVLQSRELQGRVVDALRLTERSEFNPLLDDQKYLTWTKHWVKQRIRKVFDLPAPPNTPVRTTAIDILRTKINVEPVGRSRAISVSVRGDEPALVAEIANSLVDLYIDAQLETKLAVTRKANSFLAQQAGEMKDQVRRADAEVASYRTTAGLLQGSRNTLLLNEEVSDTTSQLSTIHNKRVEAESKLQQAGDPAALPEVMGSPLISRLKEQRSQLRADAIQAETTLGPANARAVQLRAAVADADTRITQETSKIATSLHIEAQVLRLSEAVLSAKLAHLKQDLGQSGQAEVQMLALQREADVERGLLQTMLTRRQEVSIGEALQQADATILSRASVPLTPAFPRPFLFLAVSAVASVAMGCGIGLARERGDRDGLKSMDEVSPLNVKPLGLVPELPRRANPARYILDRPESAFAESLRAVVATVMLPRPGPLTLLVASALPHEGKSTTALALARLATNMGLRTLLVDADLRRPTLHVAIGSDIGLGLSDLLSERASATQVVRSDPVSALSLVFAGTPTTNAVHLLSTQAMGNAIQKWRAAFDVVILDSPPTVSLADALILARCCDEVLFVAHWNRTRRALVRAEVERLRDTGVHIAGLVLTHVNVRQHATDHYSDSGAFYDYGQGYYRN